jgi:metal-sulfur cluster biosynthetic enzyme
MRSHENEAFVLSRNTAAVMVPSGDAIELKAGLSGFITQALGGSFTLYIEEDIRQLAWQQMRSCYDPEIPINIVELGLVYECEVRPREDGERIVAVKMTLTAPGCGMGDVLVQDVKEKIEIIPTVALAEVELVFDPPWNQSMMSEAARLQTGMM